MIRNRLIRVCFILFLLMYSSSLYAQDQIGVNPPGLKWSRLESPAGSIIYPQGMDSTALNLAYRINSAYLLDTTEILSHSSKRKITTILQNQSANPEGFAIPILSRQELFLTPPQNLFMGPAIWKDGLTSHEYRHAQQFMAYNSGWTAVYKVLMGNTGWLLSAVLNVPLWFREGDAVDVETRFTNGGRGLLPAFNMEYRTLRLHNIRYSYEKAVSTSNFKDFVPNAYRTGYYLTTQLRHQYGDDIWKHVMEESNKKLFYPFSRTLKQFTGEKAPEYYTSTFNRLDSMWAQTDTVNSVVGHRISKRSDVFEKYRMPQMDYQGNLLVSYSSLKNIRGFHQLSKNGLLKKLKTAGIYTSDHENFTVEGKLMAWAESAFHPRYTNKTYSVVKYQDLTTGKVKQLSHRSRYFSPAPSKDGRFMAVIEYDKMENCSVKIIALSNEEVVGRFSYKNQFLAQPRWINNRELVMITIDEEGNQLLKLDIDQNAWEELLNAYTANLSKPFPYQDDIYFSSGLTGIENIYKLDLANRQIEQISNARFGAFDPAVYKDTLYFSNYDVNGYEIWKAPLREKLGRQVSFPTMVDRPSKTEYDKAYVRQLVDSSISIKPKYNSFFWNKMIHSYGWFPLVFPPELGIELNTLNLERSFKSTIGINYNLNEKIVQTNIRGSYAKFFTILNAGVQIQSRNIEQPGSSYNIDSLLEKDYKETIFGAGIELPLRLTQGVYHSNLNLKLDFNHHQIEENNPVVVPYSFDALNVSATISRLRKAARRQVKPLFGQYVQAHYKKGLDAESPAQFFLQGQLFFPGLYKTHSLYFRGSYENNEVIEKYRYLSLFRSSRGYAYYPFRESYLISANYELPIAYPDFYIRGFVGVGRIRFNAFFDYAKGQANDWMQLQRSFGGEFIFDLRLFRAFNMDVKLQFIKVQDHANSQRTFVFGVEVETFELLN